MFKTFNEFKTDMIYYYRQSLLNANNVCNNGSEIASDCITDTQYIMYKSNNSWYISFRGTESLTDIFTDIDCNKVTIPYENKESKIRIHDGFYQAYTSVRSKILDRLTIEYHHGEKIFISGHSLGGALAVLCALDILYNHKDIEACNVYCMTIGQPKIGNLSFCESTNKRLKNYYRIVNGDDVVPKLPTKVFRNGFNHCGELIEIGEKRFWKVASISDHRLVNYLRILL